MNYSQPFDALRQPLPVYSLRNAWYASVRTLMKTVGNLSDGIRLGNRHGFDSGVMLDYVYKNRAGGRLLIGKLLDRIYLNAIGWRGIRLRKELVIQCLKRVVAEQLMRKTRIRYLDLACGGGEYDRVVVKALHPHQLESDVSDYKQHKFAQ